MGLPQIRARVAANFPSQVIGSTGIVVTKVNGVWTVTLDLSTVTKQSPPVGNFTTDYMLVYDSVANTTIAVALSAISGLAPTYALYAATPINPAATDIIVGVDTNTIAGAVTLNLPAASSRNGIPMRIKDVTKKAATYNITLVHNGTDTIDGTAGNLVMNADGESVHLLPVTGGWLRL